MKVRYTFRVELEAEEDPQDLPVPPADQRRLERHIIQRLEQLRYGTVDCECLEVVSLEPEPEEYPGSRCTPGCGWCGMCS